MPLSGCAGRDQAAFRSSPMSADFHHNRLQRDPRRATACRCCRDEPDVPEHPPARRDLRRGRYASRHSRSHRWKTGSIIVRVPNDTTQMHDRFAELIERCVDAGVGGLKVGGGSRIGSRSWDRDGHAARPRDLRDRAGQCGARRWICARAYPHQGQWRRQQRGRCAGDAPRRRRLRRSLFRLRLSGLDSGPRYQPRVAGDIRASVDKHGYPQRSLRPRNRRGPDVPLMKIQARRNATRRDYDHRAGRALLRSRPEPRAGLRHHAVRPYHRRS